MGKNIKERKTVTGELISSLALSAGFDACGVSRADYIPDEEKHLNAWIGKGYHGELDYLNRNLDKRVDPRKLVSNAKSIISVIIAYFPGNPEVSTNPPKISRYALSPDYHRVIKGKLNTLLDLLRKEFGEVEGRAFVDSAPVLEKYWAAHAGLGWIGKNSLLINPRFGTFSFIGELIVDIEIEPAKKQIPNHCGTCTMCIDACPTGAIIQPGVIEARRCISYLTIERKAPVTADEIKSMNGWSYGCDACQEVCPWNKNIPIGKSAEMRPGREIIDLTESRLRSLSELEFKKIFKGSAIARIGWEKFKTNLSIS